MLCESECEKWMHVSCSRKNQVLHTSVASFRAFCWPASPPHLILYKHLALQSVLWQEKSTPPFCYEIRRFPSYSPSSLAALPAVLLSSHQLFLTCSPDHCVSLTWKLCSPALHSNHVQPQHTISHHLLWLFSRIPGVVKFGSFWDLFWAPNSFAVFRFHL